MHPFPFLAAFAAAALATPAFGQGPQDPQRIVVSHADLDLSSRAGIAKLDRRILTAIQIACGPTSDADLHGMNKARRCREDAAARVKIQRDLVLASARRSDATILAVRN